MIHEKTAAEAADKPDTTEEKESLYLLSHVPGVGAVTLHKIREMFGTFGKAWHMDSQKLEKTGILKEKQIRALENIRSSESVIRKQYQSLAEHGILFLAYFEDDYPDRLKPYRDCPAGLFVKGHLPRAGVPTAAIVGARNCTGYGKEMAEKLGRELAETGVQIISGLAAGVDSSAHRGCLEAGGETYAVMGCGVNICYPRENYGLFSKIETSGGILSEFLPGTPPSAGNFPMRNRILSGLSDAVIVVEARQKSGSLITADLALEQGKEVFAVPGRITDPLSTGCNRLLQMGAAVCLGVEDVLEFFELKYEKKLTDCKKSEIGLAKIENMVYSSLDSRPKSLDEIVTFCQISVAEAFESLMALEMAGLIYSEGNQYYCRKM